MNTQEVKNKFDALLKQLSTERSFDVAEKVTAELAGLLNIKVADRFLVNLPRVDAELTRFQLAPGFARQAAAYELPHEDDRPIDLKLFWTKKTSKTNLSWLIGLTPNFEDALSNDYKNMGIDFVVPETCDSVIILLSNRFKIRALELKDHITPTQLEIFAQWVKLSELVIADQNELKSTLHAKLWESFNFEPINRKFYLELVEHFSILVHHLENDFGRKPSVMFTTRLIGRLLFIWFLKKKNLVNMNVDYFSVPDPEKQAEYYKNQLEKLFFEVLNRDQIERDNGDKLTPYLNGGLFDKSTTDFFDDPKLTFPNGYFNQLFHTLNKYNFTVDESSPEFQHVAIDPEMLGRIFESLLAEQIDENTGNSKKKATGAFYTPREIVSYMCEQSLIEYLKTKVPETPDRDRRIDELVRMPEAVFRDQDQNKRRDWKPYREAIIKALEGSKTESPLAVLDPAVGSGAFPMGMLHLLVKVFSRLDPKFEKDISKLKRDILSRSLYGVDIEQTAIEITRLRAWLSIIVDIPESEKVEPLPNLEFKFVCANTLIPLDSAEQATFFTDHDLKDKLITIRDEYFKTSSKTKKEKLQKDYSKLTKNASLFDNKKTQQLKSYKPFDISSSSEFYDPELMHGVQAFDIVIGNPPYVEHKKLKNISRLLKKLYDVYTGSSDLSVYFFEFAFKNLKGNGILTYINTNKFFNTEYGSKLRNYLLEKNIIQLINFEQVPVFDKVLVSSCVIIISDSRANSDTLDFKLLYKDKHWEQNFSDGIFEKYSRTHLSNCEWSFKSKKDISIKQKIENKSVLLMDAEGINIRRGITTGYDPAFIVNSETRSNIGASVILKPLLKGEHIKRYFVKDTDLWIINSHNGLRKNNIKPINLPKDYPLAFDFLKKVDRESAGAVSSRSDQGENWFNLRNCAFLDEFDQSKIIWPLTADKWGFAFDEGKHYLASGSFMLTSKKLSLLYLLGLLNSNLLRYYFSHSGIMTAGGAFTLKKSTIERLPIKEIAESGQRVFIDLVDQILTLKKQNKDADTKNLESQIDQLVYKLYGLTDEEIRIIEGN